MNIPSDKILLPIDDIRRKKLTYEDAIVFVQEWMNNHHLTDYTWVVNPTDRDMQDDINAGLIYKFIDIGKDPASHEEWWPSGILMAREDAIVFKLTIDKI